MVAMLPLSLRSNAGSFEPSLMLTSSCRRNSSRSVIRKRCHIYWRLVVHMYYTVESGASCNVSWKSHTHALWQGHQPWTNKPQKSNFTVPQLHPCSHPPGHDNCPAQNAICKGSSKKGHWHAKCHSSGTTSQQPTKSYGAEKAHYGCQCCMKGKES